MVLLFGDSHSDAVRRAVKARRRTGSAAPVTPFRRLKSKGAGKVGNLGLRQFLLQISKLRTADVVISMIGGSQHAIFSTVQHPEPFDLYDPSGHAEPHPGATIIPYGAVFDVVRTSVLEGIELGDGSIKGDAGTLEAIRSGTRARVLHILPPPPVKDSQAIERRHEGRFVSQGIASLGVSSPELRRKFWSMQRAVLQQFCASRDIELLEPPAAATTEGFLRPEYHQGGAHANEAYGELILQQVERDVLG